MSLAISPGKHDKVQSGIWKRQAPAVLYLGSAETSPAPSIRKLFFTAFVQRSHRGETRAGPRADVLLSDRLVARRIPDAGS